MNKKSTTLTNSFLFLFVTSVFAFLTAPLLYAQSFQGLGDFPNNFFYSEAFGVSADGSVVVGLGTNDDGNNEAFRWTEGSGLESLGILPGSNQSLGTGTSADGSVVVGSSFSLDSEAFHWTETGGMKTLSGLPSEVSATRATSVSADGLVVVGNVGQDIEAFRWTEAGGFQRLGTLPGDDYSQAEGVSGDGSVVVGTSRSDNGSRQAFIWTEADGMEELGELPGGNIHSEALGVSAGGTVVVGSAFTELGYQAFRWTVEDGMRRLGDVAGENVFTHALGVSADGSVVVGRADSSKAYIWTEEDGARYLETVLKDDYDIDLTEWTLRHARDVSADGSVIVGRGIRGISSIRYEAWRAELATLTVEGPPADTLLITDESYILRWERSAGAGPVDVLLLPDTLGAASIELAIALDADTLEWKPSMDLPEVLFSRSARLAVRSTGDATLADTSAFFRVKPYALTRLSGDESEYVAFDPAQHGWPFGNTRANLFPEAWFNESQFRYVSGEDPFSHRDYDEVPFHPPANGRPWVFPDWPSWVRAFGTDDTYWTLIPHVIASYEDAALSRWSSVHGGTRWSGSCFGLAVSALLAFGHRETFGAAYPAIGPVEQLHGVGITDGVREAINELYVHQYGGLARFYRDAVGWTTRTPSETIEDLKERLGDDDPDNDGNLSIYDVKSCSPFVIDGGHAITPYRLERVSHAPEQWRVYVYDSNHPGDINRFVEVDVTAGTWSYRGWGGACGMYLRDPITNYLGEAEPTFLIAAEPAKWHERTAALREDPLLEVAASSGADVALTGSSGSIGYADGAMFNEIPGAVPEVPEVGGPAPPMGYHVPAEAYNLTLSSAPDSLLAASFFDGTRIYNYGRADADESHTDRLVFDPAAHGGRITARSEDGDATKRVTLRAIVTEDPATEQTLDVRDLPLTGADSVRFAAVDAPEGPRLRLTNEGGGKTYTLWLRQAGAEGDSAFRHVAVPLGAGAIHTVRPDWAELGEEPVQMDVDDNGDGVTDETLVLENMAVSISEDADEVPAEFILSQNYPNPFNPQTQIRFGLPVSTGVSLKVYDLLGRQVAVLIDDTLPAGYHTVDFDGSQLATGIYLYRIEAGNDQQVRKMMLVK